MHCIPTSISLQLSTMNAQINDICDGHTAFSWACTILCLLIVFIIFIHIMSCDLCVLYIHYSSNELMCALCTQWFTLIGLYRSLHFPSKHLLCTYICNEKSCIHAHLTIIWLTNNFTTRIEYIVNNSSAKTTASVRTSY